DSRVCPSNILGFQPGEVFMIRNIANLVPVMKNGPSECNAALQFAVTTLQALCGKTVFRVYSFWFISSYDKE
ncbi:carbonic anhydrase chloroplastic-like, partial [Trifolium pratense]